MKKWMIYVVMLLVASSSWAQSRLGFSADGGLTWHVDNIDETTPKTGGVTSLNGVYSFQYKKFILQAGLGISEAWLVQGVESLHREVSMLDTENMPYTLHVDLTGRRDIVAATELNVPFMFGLKVDHFYIMMGAKFMVSFVGFGTSTDISVLSSLRHSSTGSKSTIVSNNIMAHKNTIVLTAFLFSPYKSMNCLLSD